MGLTRRDLVKLSLASGALPLTSTILSSLSVAEPRPEPERGFAAVPTQKGGQDVSGPYEPVTGWPKPLTSLPGHEKWTWGALQGIFAENPDRVFLAQRGELPEIQRPENTPIPQFGPSLSFPVNEVPFRDATQGPVSALPGDSEFGGWHGKIGVDARWEHCILVVNAKGDIIEEWTQWDSLFKRPHAIHVSPYDRERNVWVVDDALHAIFKFTNNGKKLLQTIGTPTVPGSDDRHFNRPTFITWLPDSTMFVADGYNNTRVVKFDKNGKFLTAWGQEGNPPNDTRPGYFNSVHGIAADHVSGHIYVNDRSNRRVQIFDENGRFLDQWTFGDPSAVASLYVSEDHHLWASDSKTWKILKYDTQGHFLYSWGSQGDWPGAIWGVHQFSVDQEGNLYVAEASNGRAQKFRPRKDSNPDLLVGQPVRAAWK